MRCQRADARARDPGFESLRCSVYRDNNRERELARQRQYRLDHKEEIKLKNEIYRLENREKAVLYARAYRKALK